MSTDQHSRPSQFMDQPGHRSVQLMRRKVPDATLCRENSTGKPQL
jgi:hypothetical protein